MSDYEVTVEGVATLEYTDESDNTHSKRVRDVTITLPTLPEITSDGPVVVSITPVPEVLASYDMPADMFDDEIASEGVAIGEEGGTDSGGSDA